MGTIIHHVMGTPWTPGMAGKYVIADTRMEVSVHYDRRGLPTAVEVRLPGHSQNAQPVAGIEEGRILYAALPPGTPPSEVRSRLEALAEHCRHLPPQLRGGIRGIAAELNNNAGQG